MAKSPFAAGPEDDRDTEERVKKMKREAEEAEEREDPETDDDEAEPQEDRYEVGAEDDDGDEDGPVDPRPSRSDRRRDRGRSLVALERDRAERAEREAAENKRLLFEALGRQQPAQQQNFNQPQPQFDPERQRLDQEAKDLRQQLIALNGRFHQLQTSKQLTPELEAKIQDEGFDLQDRLQRNAIQRHVPRPQQQNPAMTEQAMLQAANRARFMSEHGDIAGSPVARAYFQAEWVKLLQSRAPDDWDTLNRAAESARRLAGLPARGGRPAPSAGQKRKYSGVSRGGGSGGSERGGETVTMTKEMKSMADAAYSYIKDPKKRYQYYVNRVAAKTQKRA